MIELIAVLIVILSMSSTSVNDFIITFVITIIAVAAAYVVTIEQTKVVTNDTYVVTKLGEATFAKPTTVTERVVVHPYSFLSDEIDYFIKTKR